MRLEQQVCSIDLAKKLKELGVKQDSYWYWIIDDEEEPTLSHFGVEDYICSAFSVAELGETLKKYMICSFYDTDYSAWICREMSEPSDEDYNIDYACYCDSIELRNNTEANVKASYLIHCLEKEETERGNNE